MHEFIRLFYIYHILIFSNYIHVIFYAYHLRKYIHIIFYSSVHVNLYNLPRKKLSFTQKENQRIGKYTNPQSPHCPKDPDNETNLRNAQIRRNTHSHTLYTKYK